MSPSRLFAPLFFAASFLFATFAVAAQDELVWRGDHATGRAIMEDLAKEYAKAKKGKITLQPFSTVSGLDAVSNGSADIAGSARGKFARRAEEANLNFVPVALDAAVLLTHPRNPVRTLTLKQVYDIYYGRITNWKELGGEDKAINLYAIAAPLDGVEFSLRELVYRNGDQRVAAPRLYLNTSKLEEAISIDPAGLGLSTMASTFANKGVKSLAIEGIDASTSRVADGSYPLYITLYSVSRTDSPKQPAIDAFIAFLATPPAKDILRKHQLTPYADVTDVVAKNEQRMAFIDAHVGRDAAAIASANMAGGAPTPVSAPRAVLESKNRIAPTAESTQAARENLARAEAKKAAANEKATSNLAPPISVTPVAPAPVAAAPVAAAAEPKASVAAAAPKKEAAPAKPKAKKVAKAAPAKAPAKTEAPAKAPVSFGNVTGGESSGH
jgi:phosphate transport system substrate-binding protein